MKHYIMGTSLSFIIINKFGMDSVSLTFFYFCFRWGIRLFHREIRISFDPKKKKRKMQCMVGGPQNRRDRTKKRKEKVLINTPQELGRSIGSFQLGHVGAIISWNTICAFHVRVGTKKLTKTQNSELRKAWPTVIIWFWGGEITLNSYPFDSGERCPVWIPLLPRDTEPHRSQFCWENWRRILPLPSCHLLVHSSSSPLVTIQLFFHFYQLPMNPLFFNGFGIFLFLYQSN